jgi:hypothetical protein
MLVDLDKNGLEALVRGSIPTYKQMEIEVIKTVGGMEGGQNDHWEWDFWALQKLSESELHNIYEILKKK